MWKVSTDHSAVQWMLEREGSEILHFKVYAESLPVIIAVGRQETSRSVEDSPLIWGYV